jgi:hypothetical protein
MKLHGEQGGDHQEKVYFYVANIGQDIILGTDWLTKHNPDVDWWTSTLHMTQCPPPCRTKLAIKIKAKANPKSQPIQAKLAQVKTQPPLQGVVELEDKEDSAKWTPEPLNIWQTEINPLKKYSNVSQKLAQESKKHALKKSTGNIVPEWCHEFLKVFDEKEANRFPTSRPWDHAIETKPGYIPKDCKVYPLSPNEKNSMDAWIDEQLAKGYIRQSKSPQASPVFFVGKKDGDLHPTQDYRYINKWTIRNSYPLPLIPELVDKLKGAKYFTKMDVRKGYNNVLIKEGDQWKAAFKTSRGLYEPLVMFFGLCNSPATFQAMMNNLFKDLVDQNVVIVYLDDSLIYTKTLEEHQKEVKQVLKILQDNDLYLKPDKCEFEKTKVEYLGLIISHNHVEMDLVKVQGIVDWPTPSKVKDVQAFLGFCNFYQRFVEGFSHVATTSI